MAHFKEKKLDVAAETSPPALDSLSGNKDSAKAERLPPSRRRTSRHLSFPDAALFTDGPQAGAPVNARSFCTSPCGRHGNGHWAQPVCRTKGALGGTAGTALASGAHRMAIAEESTEHIHAFHQGLPRVSLPVTTAGAGRRVMRQGKRGIV